MIWYVAWLLTASATPHIVWSEQNGAEFEWNTTETQGKIVFPFAGASIGIGTTPIYVEMRNKDGNAHHLEIACTASNEQRLISGEWDVPERLTVSEVVPLGVGVYTMDCDVTVDGKKVHSDGFYASKWQGGELLPMLMIDGKKSQQAYPEWMIASSQETKEHQLWHIKDSSMLPVDSSAYLGLYTVVWFPQERKITSMQEKALFEWLQQGGHVVLVDPLSGETPWNAWMDTRFEEDLGWKDVSSMKHPLNWTRFVEGFSPEDLETYREAREFEPMPSEDLHHYRVGKGYLSVIRGAVSVQSAYFALHLPVGNQTGVFSFYPYASGEPLFADETVYWDRAALLRFVQRDPLFELIPNTVLYLLSLGFTVLLLVLLLRKDSRLHWLWRVPLFGVLSMLVVLSIDFLSVRKNRGGTMEFFTWDSRTSQLIGSTERLFWIGHTDSEMVSKSSHTQLVPLRVASGDPRPSIHMDASGTRIERANLLREMQANFTYHSIAQRRGFRVENGVFFNDLDQNLNKVVYRDATGQYFEANDVQGGGSVQLQAIDTLPEIRTWFPALWVAQRTYDVSSIPLNSVLVHTAEEVTWDGLDGSKGHFDSVDRDMTLRSTLILGVLQ